MRVISAVVLLAVALQLCVSVVSAEQLYTSAGTRVPAQYAVRFETTVKGGSSFIVNITTSLAPRGSQRFLELVESKYFDNSGFFRW
jgi:hypothetical protein